MNVKDLTRSIDVVRIALGVPTTAERIAKADRLIAESGVKMLPGRDGVLIQLANGRAVFAPARILTA